MDEDLALRIDFEDGAAAVADEEVALGVEGRAGGHAHALGVEGGLAGVVDAVDVALGARGDEEVALGIEGQAGGVEDAGDEGRAAAVGADAHHRYGGLLAARAGDGGVDHAGAADRRAGDRMQAVRELMSNAQRHGVADAGGVAEFDQAGGGVRGDAEGQASGPAHQHLSRLAAKQNRGRSGGGWTEMSADQLHFAERQRGSGIDGVDARLGKDFGGGLGAEAGHLYPQVQERCYTQSIQPGCYIIEDDAPAAGQVFKPANGKGLGDVEEAEEEESDQCVVQVEGAEEQGDPLAGDFIDDDELRVVAAAFAGNDGGGRDAEEQRETDAGEEREEQGVRSGMEELCVGGPEQDGCYGAPGAGAGLAEACAEEGCHRPCPPLRGVLVLVESSGRAIRHGSLRCGCR